MVSEILYCFKVIMHLIRSNRGTISGSVGGLNSFDQSKDGQEQEVTHSFVLKLYSCNNRLAGFPTKFLPFYCLIFLLVAFHNTPVNAGCPRGSRCSDRSGLRREWRRTIDFLVPSSRLLTGLTYRALNYMVSSIGFDGYLQSAPIN